MNSTHANEDNISSVGRDTRGGPTGARPSVAVGFGSPADDTGVTRLDLNDILVKHPQATFLMRVTGNAMHETGIDDGDLLLVDRAVTPANGHVIIAVVEEEFVCRRLVKHGSDQPCGPQKCRPSRRVAAELAQSTRCGTMKPWCCSARSSFG